MRLETPRVAIAGLAGDSGKAYTDMSIATIRSVSKGVVGVAIIQALLAGMGLLVMDVPAAGIWTALVLVLAVVQLPPLLVLAPVAVWVFSVSESSGLWPRTTSCRPKMSSREPYSPRTWKKG